MSSKRVSSRRMLKLTREFFDAGKREHIPCWICGQPIDYTIRAGTEPMSHELDHYYPVSTHPHLQEDPANFRHAHRECNQRRGNRLQAADLGVSMPAWW